MRVNRDHHAQTSAVMAMQLLADMGMPDLEIVQVMGAIGNHHENDGDPVSPGGRGGDPRRQERRPSHARARIPT
jgi:hypothetical protein